MLVKQIIQLLISVSIIACAALLTVNDVFANQEDSQAKTSYAGEQPCDNSDNQDFIKGYPTRQRRIGTPTDVENDLDNSFPKRGSLLEMMLRSKDAQP